MLAITVKEEKMIMNAEEQKKTKKVDMKRVDSMKEHGNRNNDKSNIPINKNKKKELIMCQM